MRLLIVKLSALGDVIQTLPALALLRRDWPEAQIDWVVEERNAELLKGHSYLRRLILFRKEFLSRPGELKSFLKSLRQEYYEAIIDFQGLLKSALMARLARGRLRFGFANHREGSPFFYTVKFQPYDLELHAVRRYLLLAKKVTLYLRYGKEFDPEEPLELIRDIPLEGERPEGFLFPKPYFLFIPSARWETKLWPFTYWEELLALLEEYRKDFDIYFVGAKGEQAEPYAEAMARKYKGVFTLIGKLSLRELVYVMRGALGVVTVDTGPMHLASLLNKPIIALFGPTSPGRTGPWSDYSRVLQANLFCSPCFRRQCRDRACMYSLKPETVFQEMQYLLRNLPKIMT